MTTKEQLNGQHVIYSMKAMLTMALHSTLAAQGVNDPKLFLEENAVEYSAVFDKPTACASIFIVSVMPRAKAERLVEDVAV